MCVVVAALIQPPLLDTMLLLLHYLHLCALNADDGEEEVEGLIGQHISLSSIVVRRQ